MCFWTFAEYGSRDGCGTREVSAHLCPLYCNNSSASPVGVCTYAHVLSYCACVGLIGDLPQELKVDVADGNSENRATNLSLMRPLTAALCTGSPALVRAVVQRVRQCNPALWRLRRFLAFNDR
jgi:hypothetical protein